MKDARARDKAIIEKFIDFEKFISYHTRAKQDLAAFFLLHYNVSLLRPFPDLRPHLCIETFLKPPSLFSKSALYISSDAYVRMALVTTGDTPAAPYQGPWVQQNLAVMETSLCSLVVRTRRWQSACSDIRLCNAFQASRSALEHTYIYTF